MPDVRHMLYNIYFNVCLYIVKLVLLYYYIKLYADNLYRSEKKT